jgi:hypothetical protein
MPACTLVELWDLGLHRAMPAKRSRLRRLLGDLVKLARPGWPGLPAWPLTIALPRPRRITGLHECPVCHSDRVAPTAIAEADDKHWHVRLRCGECEHTRELRITNAQAAAYDEALDRHTAAMRRELAALEQARMATEIDAFVRALALDLIEASDFAR